MIINHIPIPVNMAPTRIPALFLLHKFLNTKPRHTRYFVRRKRSKTRMSLDRTAFPRTSGALSRFFAGFYTSNYLILLSYILSRQYYILHGQQKFSRLLGPHELFQWVSDVSMELLLLIRSCCEQCTGYGVFITEEFRMHGKPQGTLE